MLCLFYYTHHNWDWVVKESINDLCNQSEFHSSLSVNHCRISSELPSQKIQKEKPKYSLFRVELVQLNGNIAGTWVTSTAFTMLDYKDSLYASLKAKKALKMVIL